MTTSPTPVSRQVSRPGQERARSYHAGILTAAAVVLFAAAVLQVRGETQVALLGVALPESCAWRRLMGLNCPGCGLTRSFVSLAHGEVSRAWHFHPLGPLLFGVVAMQLPYRGFQLWRLSHSLPELKGRWTIGIPVLLAVALGARWIVWVGEWIIERW